MIEYTEISVLEFKEKFEHKDYFLLDVRTTEEYDTANIGGVLIPLHELPERISELDHSKEREIICMCHHGGRSARAAQLLTSEGFPNVKNLVGGIHLWSLEVDSNIPTY